MGWDRYDTQEAVDAMNDLYRNELRLFMNLFMPSMKLLRKERIGSKVKRVYDKSQTPFQRVIASKHGDPVDRIPFIKQKEVIAAIYHDNIRGKEYFSEETTS
jgi:hypothetical protein